MAELAPGIPETPVNDLLAWLRKAKVKTLLVGGVAVALLGRPRFTRDVDALVFIEDDQLADFLKQGEAFSFMPRIPDALEFAEQRRVLLVRHEKTAIDIDLIIAGVPFETAALERAQVVKIGRKSYPVPNPADFVVMKAVANRDHDKRDIEGVLDCWPDVDHAYIRRWVDEFAEALETPEISDDIAATLSRRERPKTRGKRRK